MGKLFVGCFLLLSNVFLQAQQATNLRRATPLAAIPFKILSGGIILIEAKISGYKDTLNFIFDTGSGSISIDSTTVALLAIPTKQSDRKIKGIGGSKKIEIVDSLHFKMQNIVLPNTELFIADYTNISEYYGVKIDGIVGYNFIHKYVLKINYDVNKIFVYPIANYKYGIGRTVPLRIAGIPTFTATVADAKTIKGNYIFDTGGDMQLMLAENFTNDSLIINRKRKPVETFAEGFGGRTSMMLTVVKKMEFAGYTFKNVPTFIYNDSINVINYPNRHGIIGNEIGKRFNVILNYSKSEMHIVPNKNFSLPFYYGYSGLDLYLIDKEIYAGSIGKGSPAESAGILQNDHILGIGVNFSNNISEYKDLLEKENEYLNIFVERNKKPVLLKLKVGTYR